MVPFLVPSFGSKVSGPNFGSQCLIQKSMKCDTFPNFAMSQRVPPLVRDQFLQCITLFAKTGEVRERRNAGTQARRVLSAPTSKRWRTLGGLGCSVRSDLALQLLPDGSEFRLPGLLSYYVVSPSPSSKSDFLAAPNSDFLACCHTRLSVPCLAQNSDFLAAPNSDFLAAPNSDFLAAPNSDFLACCHTRLSVPCLAPNSDFLAAPNSDFLACCHTTSCLPFPAQN